MNDFLESIEREQTDLLGNALSKYEHLRVTAEKTYPNTEPIITWNDQGVASPGNITGISAPPKAGKTAVSSVLAAGAISKFGDIDGFPAIQVKPNPAGLAVVVMDTEQSEYDQQYNIKTTLRRAGLRATPNNFLCYNIRQLSMNEYRDVTNEICESAAQEFSGIHSIFIDGGADYIRSANDEEKSAEIIEYFTHLAIRFNCAVIIVVHTNPGGDKERGHFGSYLQRKCYGILTIEARDGISILRGKATRKAGDFDPICFKYDSDKGYHIQVDAPDRDAERDEKQIEKARAALVAALAEPTGYRHNDAVKAIMKVNKINSDRTAKNYLKIGEAQDILKHEGDLYYLNNERGNLG